MELRDYALLSIKGVYTTHVVHGLRSLLAVHYFRGSMFLCDAKYKSLTTVIDILNTY